MFPHISSSFTIPLRNQSITEVTVTPNTPVTRVRPSNGTKPRFLLIWSPQPVKYIRSDHHVQTLDHQVRQNQGKTTGKEVSFTIGTRTWSYSDMLAHRTGNYFFQASDWPAQLHSDRYITPIGLAFILMCLCVSLCLFFI